LAAAIFPEGEVLSVQCSVFSKSVSEKYLYIVSPGLLFLPGLLNLGKQEGGGGQDMLRKVGFRTASKRIGCQLAY
jgi:hypothetical protein